MDNQQLQNKITELEKRVQELTNELKYEEIAHNLVLDGERKKRQLLEQQLTQKQTELTNYETQLRAERNQNVNLNLELQEKDRRIQELTQQLKTMIDLLEQDLTGQVEFPPRS